MMSCDDTRAVFGPVAKWKQFDANAPHRLPNPRRRALVNASNTFNLNQTERFLTQRLIFGVGNSGTKWANKGEDVA
jgi:hypothetical protein